MDSDVKFDAAGRKGEEAVDVDVSGMLVGDWLTVIVQGEPEPVAMKLVKMGEGSFHLIAGSAHREVEAGETYVQLGASGMNEASIDLIRKRDPKADLEQAERGEFTT